MVVAIGGHALRHEGGCTTPAPLAGTPQTTHREARSALHFGPAYGAQVTLGSALRAVRVEGELSLRETAEFLGISAVELGEYERGKREPASWRHVFERTVHLATSKAHEVGFEAGQTYDPCGGA